MKRSLQLNPDNRPATWKQIEYWRDIHEASPVNTSFGEFHADALSITERMAGSIEQFDSLPTLNPDGTLRWKQPGQTYVDLTKSELEQVYNEVKTNRAIRGALLHVKAEQFRQQATPPTPAQLADLSFWLGE